MKIKLKVKIRHSKGIYMANFDCCGEKSLSCLLTARNVHLGGLIFCAEDQELRQVIWAIAHKKKTDVIYIMCKKSVAQQNPIV